MLSYIGRSRAHGTSNEHSDIDVRGVFLERSSDIFGDTENVAKVECCGLQSY